MERKFKTRKNIIINPVNRVYPKHPVGGKEWTKLQNERILKKNIYIQSIKTSISNKKNKCWLRKDDGYVMSISDRLTKYGDCG